MMNPYENENDENAYTIDGIRLGVAANRRRAELFLQEFLAEGPRPAADLNAAAAEQKICEQDAGTRAQGTCIGKTKEGAGRLVFLAPDTAPEAEMNTAKAHADEVGGDDGHDDVDE